MSQIFNTPKEAYEACDTELVNSWNQFVTNHKIVESDNPEAYKTLYYTFQVGFKSGATFISSLIVDKLQSE
jgi:hypothetical protein